MCRYPQEFGAGILTLGFVFGTCNECLPCMQDLPLIRAVAGVREALMEAMPVLQEGPGGPRTRREVRKALEALDRVRPEWETHFGVEGLAFPLDRLVYLPTRSSRFLVYSTNILFVLRLVFSYLYA